MIAVIGILGMVAIPRFSATRDDALITKGKNILSSVRSAIATERQKRVLRGDFAAISNLTCNGSTKVFDCFDNNASNPPLEYPPTSCNKVGCWSGSGSSYTFYYNGGTCTYTLSNNRLPVNSGGCPPFDE